MSSGRVPAVFLDRDGVLNDVVVRGGKPYPPALVADLRIFKDARPSLLGFRRAGYRTIVVTNQPDVATGVQQAQIVEEIHRRLAGELAIDAFKVCFHVDAHGCACRKPRPGMLLEAADEWNIDLSRSWMIGDRWRDVDAGRAAGCRTVWIDRNYTEQQPVDPDHVARSIHEAARFILGPSAGSR